jgi:tyrosinase
MAVVRRNILTNTAARDAFISGVLLLKNEVSPVATTATFGITGPATPVRAYDLFVIWHHIAMTTLTPLPPTPNPNQRNVAHRGPMFLPWHRVFLLFLEQNIQRVLADPTFGLPYWDWSLDGSLPPAAQASTPIWTDAWLGGGGNPVTTGKFAFSPADPSSFRVRLETDPVTKQLRQTDRGLRRAFGMMGASSLPNAVEVGLLFNPLDLTLNAYDNPDWDAASQGFRNRLEGTATGGTGLHNQVHNWVGADMMPPSSPNDPVFFLHHCNVDRIWQGWLNRHGNVYQPDMAAPGAPIGHRINDPILSPLLPGMTVATPATTLGVSASYSFDVVP